jgi:hypothetical protein
MMIIPRRSVFVALMLIASIDRADAQFFQRIFGFLTSSFNFLCPIVEPVFESFFNITLPDCIEISVPGPGPAPAPTKKGKVTTGTDAPVAPPSITP